MKRKKKYKQTVAKIVKSEEKEETAKPVYKDTSNSKGKPYYHAHTARLGQKTCIEPEIETSATRGYLNRLKNDSPSIELIIWFMDNYDSLPIFNDLYLISWIEEIKGVFKSERKTAKIKSEHLLDFYESIKKGISGTKSSLFESHVNNIRKLKKAIESKND